MGHEVGDALEHAARLEDEGRERHTRQIHADSGGGRLAGGSGGEKRGARDEAPRKTHLSCEMSDMMMDPSFSSLAES